jgi:hypothetical protein
VQNVSMPRADGMADLTEKEFWLITVYFKNDRGFGGSHSLTDIHISRSIYDCSSIKPHLGKKIVM